MNMPTTSLPVFRVAGMSGRISFDNEHAQRQQLWQDYDLSRLNDDLPAFSQTIYCVLHQYDDKGYTATLGRLVPNDASLPENVDEFKDQKLTARNVTYTKSEKNAFLVNSVTRVELVDKYNVVRAAYEKNEDNKYYRVTFWTDLVKAIMIPEVMMY